MILLLSAEHLFENFLTLAKKGESYENRFKSA